MHLLLVLAALLLAACSNTTSLDSRYRDANNLFVTEQYDHALRGATEGLEQAKRKGTEKDRWQFCLLKADILAGQRLSAKALAWLNECGQPPQGTNLIEERAHVLLLKGRASAELNRPADADQFLQQAAEAAHEADSESLTAEVQLQQGRVLIQRSRFDDARQLLRTVADAAARRDDSYREASAFGNIGFSFLTESRNDEAIPWFEKALTLFTRVGAAESMARAQGNLGNCYFRLGDYDEARARYEKAEASFAKTGNLENQQIWIGNAGNVAYQTGEFASAADSYRRALEIARRVPSPVWAGRWLNNLAEASLELGRWDDAEKYSHDALDTMHQLHDSNWEPTSMVTAARIEEGRGHPDRARELFRAALTKRAEDPSVELDSHAGLARTWVSEGNTAQADLEFRNTVAVIEQRRANLLKDDYKLPYLASLIQFYQEYVDFLVGRQQEGKALEVAESSRSRVLESRVADAKNAPATRPIHETSHDYRRLAQQTHSVILEYWLGPRHSYLWVITGDSISLHELPARATIHSLIANYQQTITNSRNPLEAAGETGHRLYDALLMPAGEAGKKGRFLIVPDQDLYSFDLETLPAPGQTRRFWIEDATISIAPSLDFLIDTFQTSHAAAATSLLVMGDAPDEGPEYPHLQYASQEIDSVRKTMAAKSATVWKGVEATPAAYTNSQPGRFEFIHFAAHAMANRQSPLDSAVILAGPPDANRLLARSVMAVPLNADLVTISACRSAGGKTYAGEGLVGFAWAFLRAGARNVIAGLWDVSDRSTEQLMTSLYRHIASGDELPTALRAAKLELMHEGGAYAKPFYWAPFQLYSGPGRK
jgi:CHAT domain-containing protein/predicted negative regulator of RcsB-dependent stress response